MNKDNYFDDDFEVIYDALDELDDYDETNNNTQDNCHERDYGKSHDHGKRSKQKKRRNVPNLLSPASKAVKTGGKAAYKIIQTVLRTATLILITAIIALLAINFWNGHTAYGNAARAVAEKNYALAAYTGVAVFLLLFEVIAFLWALSVQKVPDGRRVRKLDTGRGMCSFLLIYAGSFLSNMLGYIIPDSPQIISGLKGAAAVYGSLNETLLLLCAAGVLSCLVRKFMFH